MTRLAVALVVALLGVMVVADALGDLGAPGTFLTRVWGVASLLAGAALLHYAWGLGEA